MIGLRIDVDGYYGLVYGVPNLLDLFDKHGLKATFFINMGKEANILDLFRYRLLKRKGLSSVDLAVGWRYSLKQKLRMALFPQKLGCVHCEILKEIEKRGHEAQVHAWNHLKWTKDFENINVEEELTNMINSYEMCLGKKPIGIVCPQFRYDKRVLDALDKFGFKYAGDMPGDKPFYPAPEGKKYAHMQIPTTLTENIEEMKNRGLSLEQIKNTFKNHIDAGGYRCIYFHADYEGLKGLSDFEELLKFLKIKTNTYNDIYKKYK